ncbi:hypothetical protein B0T10DRAFT_500982 [Thelonectria olida]|uniref:Uncharacterized protein n=1 Tax=Thelonectria olida TaxID=1576542 RepID=A0A9P9AI50_9HYPO|nr:hypothetical protein B0T10DRAFT_500982 [Thelonectria olida]
MTPDRRPNSAPRRKPVPNQGQTHTTPQPERAFELTNRYGSSSGSTGSAQPPRIPVPTDPVQAARQLSGLYPPPAPPLPTDVQFDDGLRGLRIDIPLQAPLSAGYPIWLQQRGISREEFDRILGRIDVRNREITNHGLKVYTLVSLLTCCMCVFCIGTWADTMRITKMSAFAVQLSEQYEHHGISFRFDPPRGFESARMFIDVA